MNTSPTNKSHGTPAHVTIADAAAELLATGGYAVEVLPTLDSVTFTVRHHARPGSTLERRYAREVIEAGALTSSAIAELLARVFRTVTKPQHTAVRYGR